MGICMCLTVLLRVCAWFCTVLTKSTKSTQRSIRNHANFGDSGFGDCGCGDPGFGDSAFIGSAASAIGHPSALLRPSPAHSLHLTRISNRPANLSAVQPSPLHFPHICRSGSTAGRTVCRVAGLITWAVHLKVYDSKESRVFLEVTYLPTYLWYLPTRCKRFEVLLVYLEFSGT